MAIQASTQTNYLEDAAAFPDFTVPEIANLNAPRFFVQFTYDSMSVDTFSIPGCALKRAIITPCVSFKQKLPLHEIREADLLHGTKEADRDTGRPYYGQIWRYATVEADRLVGIEKDASYPTGLREVVSLRDVPHEYRRMANHLFYSGVVSWSELETNDSMLSHLRNRLASLRADPPPELKPDVRAALEKAGEELIEACEYSDGIQRARIESTHAAMKLPPTDTHHKKAYDDVDLLFLRRTGLKRLSEVDQRMAGALEKLSNAQTGDPEIKQLLGNMNQLLGLLVSERTEPAKKGAK